MADVLAQATVVVGGQVDPGIGADIAKSFDKVDDAIDDAAAALARVQSAVDDARTTSTRAFGELSESSNLARDGFGDLSTAASAVGSGLAATGVISEETGQKFTAVADTLGGVEGAFTAVKGASALAGSAVTSMSGKLRASTVVTRAMTVAQRALNVVLRANPIGLVVTAIGLLAAAFVVAYKKSETFRNIVNTALKGVLAAARAVKNFLAGIFDGVAEAGAFAFGKIRDGINNVIQGINFVIRQVNRIPGVDLPDIQYLARGVRNFRGGLAVVGEQGPELVSLPRGANVYSNRESAGMGGTTVNYNFYGPTTGADRKRETDWFMRYGATYGPSSAFGGAA